MLAGRHALVTGASRGIGRAIALALAEQGASLTLVARSPDDLDAVTAEARQLGAEVTPVSADVCQPAAMADAFDAAGTVPDILVTAAGINRPGPITELPLDDVLEVIEINVRGTVIACREFGRHLIGAGRPGAVVTVSSQMGVVGYPGRAAYCASKHAINGLTKALALEWAPHAIRVNAIAPTFIHTPLTAPMFEDEAFRDEVLSRIPLGRIGETADVVGAVRFLLSEEAGLITGHVLAIDGGWTVQ
jgi:NAD(P)-dependent dehydrogenase (short-subunit alcohol dehydrogenase family)